MPRPLHVVAAEQRADQHSSGCGKARRSTSKYKWPLVLTTSLLFGIAFVVPLGGKSLPIYYSDLFVLSFLAGAALVVKRVQRIPMAYGAWLLFAMWATASAFWSIDPLRTLGAAWRLWLAVSLAVVLYWRLPRTSWTPDLAVRVFGIALSLWALARVPWNAITASGLSVHIHQVKHSVSVPLGVSNYLATFLLFCLIYEVVRGKRGWWVTAAFNAAALIGTFSKGAFLALSVSLAILIGLAFALPKPIRREVLHRILSITVIVAAVPILMFALVPQVALDVVASQEVSELGRLSLWSQALDQFYERPLSGIGHGAFQGQEFGDSPEMRRPHNWVLQLLSETGLIGSVLYGAFVLFLFGKSGTVLILRPPAARPMALGLAATWAALLAMHVHGLVEIIFEAPAGSIWLSIFSAVLLRGAEARQEKRFSPFSAHDGPPPLREVPAEGVL